MKRVLENNRGVLKHHLVPDDDNNSNEEIMDEIREAKSGRGLLILILILNVIMIGLLGWLIMWAVAKFNTSTLILASPTTTPTQQERNLISETLMAMPVVSFTQTWVQATEVKGAM